MSDAAFLVDDLVDDAAVAAPAAADAWSVSAQSPHGRLEVVTAADGESGLAGLVEELACKVSGTPGSRFEGKFSRSGDPMAEWWPADLYVPTLYGGSTCLSRWLLMMHPPGTVPAERVPPPLFQPPPASATE